MKNRFVLRFFGYVLIVFLFCSSEVTVFAHPSSQGGILAKSYVDRPGSIYYNKYFIGGDDVGWRIMEERHTNGFTQTYEFSSSLSNALKEYVRDGAEMWDDVIDIQERTDGSAKGWVYAYRDNYSPAGAEFLAPLSADFVDDYGHLKKWEIEINLAYEDAIDAITLAHEFGHMIGLTDLYENQSRNKLMYGTVGRTVTSPTSSDIWGAKVITGAHTSHTWGYKYFGASSTGGNSHIKYCKSCNGLTNSVYNCTYNSQNVCTLCGIPKGANISSVEQDMEQS